ncbi:YhcN/YlaJ family sporulation lipoprotein [Thermoactinomyces sp. DSM 45892]|uniref:YhcN/YlaJ family sporulation lipoprotein n=1 Tax=Thermoactinomyces sp. DSM 45892 TaxID=1882753 RepID=UPI0008992A3C|nr:YhcN/YlaJ family sporulation lipoprotein [Thermoactinomyces sp. DSM 45892]SDY68232.1 sporulation lipoprotein, YhcN/YlaJ family [Thermoactinomyces sp. DSM 45892]
MGMSRVGKVLLLSVVLVSSSIGCAVYSRKESNHLNDPNYNPIKVSAPENKNQGMNPAFQQDEEMERKIQDLPKVKDATVLLTGETAYVGLRMEQDFTHFTMTPMMRKKVTDVVRQARPEIRSVYLSVQPDFVKTVTDITEQARNNKPMNDFNQQLKNMVERFSLSPE